MDSIWSEPQNDAFFLPSTLQNGDSFDMETFNPFDDATFSIPEGDLPNALNSLPYASQLPSADFKQDSISPLSQATPSSSPQSLQSALELEFPAGALSSSDSPDTSPVDDWLFNPTTGEVSLGQETREASKRSKNNAEGDSISACWTSPLCPNKKGDGSRPDSCKGECADFLFAHPSELPDDKKFLSEIMAKSEPKITLDASIRGTKRHEIESTPEEIPRPRASLSKDVSRSTRSQSAATSSSSVVTLPANNEPKARRPSSASQSAAQSAKPKGRVPHNQVEKKYRENVNAQLEALRRVVPVSRQQLAGFDGFDIEDLGANSRLPSKAVVLASATAYIKQLEREQERMAEEMASLKTQNKTLQSLVKCEDCSLMNYMKRWKIQTGV